MDFPKEFIASTQKSLPVNEAQCYLKRGFLGHSPKKLGGVALVWNGFYLGTANAVKNGLNNLLPMELRVRGDFATQSILCL